MKDPALSLLETALKEWADRNPAMAKSDRYAEAVGLLDLLDDDMDEEDDDSPPWDEDDEDDLEPLSFEDDES